MRDAALNRAATIAAVFLFAASQAGAQQQQPPLNRHKGFWLSFGPTVPLVNVSCEGCGALPNDGTGLYLRLGGAVGKRLLIGAELSGWVDDYAGRYAPPNLGDISGSTLLALAQLYPERSQRLFVTAGIGVADATIDPRETPRLNPPGERTITAVAIDLGVGVDFRVLRKMHITLRFDHAILMDKDVAVRSNTLNEKAPFSYNATSFGVTWF